MNIVEKAIRYGPRKALQKAGRRASRPFHKLRTRRAPTYPKPDASSLSRIERELEQSGIIVKPLYISPARFKDFQTRFAFTAGYKRGRALLNWDEKLLEHFISFQLGQLEDFRPDRDSYVDVAASNSPWALMLRDHGYKAYAIDLDVGILYKHLPFYQEQDAKNTSFQDNSIKAISLQCAFEMFLKNDDRLFIDECSRILVPGGKVIIVPLYLNTHHCGYSTPEYYNQGYADMEAAEYIRRDFWGVPFCRNYSPRSLRTRIIDRILQAGMKYNLYKLMNQEELGDGIYCHFVLEVIK